MKRLIIALTIALAILAFNAKTLEAQESGCPNGYSTTTVPVFAGGCYWDVQICYLCGMHSFSQLILFGITKQDPECEHVGLMSDIIKDISEIVFEYNYIKKYICTSQNVYPCDEPPFGVDYSIAIPMCWQKYSDMQGVVSLKPCNLNSDLLYCVQIWKMCWNPITQKTERVLVQQVTSGNYACPEPSTPPADPQAGQSSPCYRISTDCD